MVTCTIPLLAQVCASLYIIHERHTRPCGLIGASSVLQFTRANVCSLATPVCQRCVLFEKTKHMSWFLVCHPVVNLASLIVLH